MRSTNQGSVEAASAPSGVNQRTPLFSSSQTVRGSRYQRTSLFSSSQTVRGSCSSASMR